MTTQTQKLADYCATAISQSQARACNCIGPQNGEPLCPCQMRTVQVKDGRYVMPERDLGPAPAKRGILNPTQK